MQRERITDHIYVFTSDLYAQVTASLIVTDEGAVLIDTLPYPEETKLIKQFVETRLNTTVRYVVNSHFHADHTTGTSFFKNALVIGQQLCRQLLNERGRESLESTRNTGPDMRDLELVLPQITFDRTLTLHLGGKTLQFQWSPGHSADSIVCLLVEDQILFAADTVMPIPYFVDGSYDDFLASLEMLRGGSYENIVQGHGEVILRGEVEEKLESDIEYLYRLSQAVDTALLNPSLEAALAAIDIEACGKERVLLNGAAQQLHRQNVMILAEQRRERVKLSRQ